MKVYLEDDEFGNFILVAENGQSILVQSDWDYPGVATNFGWVPCPECGFTDGTVDCKHRTVHEMIAEACEYLDEQVGNCIEDPGYFES
jgi:hypothetical protein